MFRGRAIDASPPRHRSIRAMASLTVENYVKTIHRITASQEGRPATTGELAAALGVSPGTVTSMLKTLDAARLAVHRPYEGVSLTKAGRILALRVIRRHRLLELFLHRTLDMSWDEVHDEAEHMEHAVSDLLVDRIDAFLGKESDNVFVAVAMLIGLLAGLAIVSAVAVWQWRPHRGPVLAAALWIGQIAAAAAAAGTGAALAHWRYGTPDRLGAQLGPENRVAYFTEAPPVFPGHSPFQIAVTLLLPAALAALVYATLAIANPREDLGGWPAQERFRNPGYPYSQNQPEITGAGTEPVRPA